MHDEHLERRLRSALREEGDRLPFTITSADLEQRAAIHGRGASNPRLTLLLAAAVAIGALGAGAILSGLSNRPAPSPVANATDSLETGARTAPAIVLPSLDDLMAVESQDVLVAQAWGPADNPGQPVPVAVQVTSTIVALGDLQARGDYRISAACLGRIPLEIAIVPVGTGEAIEGPRFPCDGAVHDDTVHIDGPASAFIWYRDTTSWRVVVRGTRTSLPLPTSNPVLPGVFGDPDELVRLDNATIDALNSPILGSSGLPYEHVGAVPARVIYGVMTWCEPGPSMRVLFADEIAAVLTPSMETVVACDGLEHDLGMPLPLPNGSPVYIAASPSTHWSVVVGSAAPIHLADDIPGWTVNGGAGPSLHFEDTEISFSDVAGDHGGPLMVIVDCQGPAQDIDVFVDRTGILGDKFDTYTATCALDGARASWTFDTPATGYIVRHQAPAGTWTALTLLVPRGSPTP